MGFYEDRIKGKTTEAILQTAAGGAGGSCPGEDGEVLRVAAQIRITQDSIISQEACTKQLVDSVQTLVASLNVASADSGKLGTRIAWLTGALVAVGVGQIVATAWSYLGWWFQHRG